MTITVSAANAAETAHRNGIISMKFKPANSHSGGRAGMVIALLVGLTGIAGATLATPAQAAARCPAGAHCLFARAATGGLEAHAFTQSDADFSNDTYPDGQPVNNNSVGAANASTGFESHYYDGPLFNGFLFCLNPGTTVFEMPDVLKNRASSLQVRAQTTIHCLSN